MDKEKIYSIYLLTSPSGKQYCGYTSKKPSRRWDNGNGYIKCPALWRAIQKYGWENFQKEIIFQTKNQEEAFYKEIDIIAKLELQNPKKGYNLDRGGRPHGSNDYLTDEGRKKISQATKKRWQNPEYRAKMIEKHKQCPPTRQCIEAAKIATSKRRKGQTPSNALPVEQLDKNTDLVINSFISASHASKAMIGEVVGCSNILKVCRGERKTAYGYKWRFKK